MTECVASLHGKYNISFELSDEFNNCRSFFVRHFALNNRPAPARDGGMKNYLPATILDSE